MMLKKALLGLVILVVVITAAAYIFLRTGLPDYRSDVVASSLSAPVTVERNSYAMPTITADTMEDLFFAWGYVNAQDRLFQMEFTRRVGQGRISEFAGADNESVSDIATLAFVESCQLLEEAFNNPDPASWKWGEIHKIRFDHVLGSSALLRPLVNYGPFSFAGDGETNKRARFNEMAPPFIADLASAPRIVVSFEPQPKAYMMLITGQNEYFLSKHNTDMTDAWLANDYFSVDDEPVTYTMKLLP